VKRTGSLQKIDSGAIRQVVIGNEQRDGLVLLRQLA